MTNVWKPNSWSVVVHHALSARLRRSPVPLAYPEVNCGLYRYALVLSDRTMNASCWPAVTTIFRLVTSALAQAPGFPVSLMLVEIDAAGMATEPKLCVSS